MLPSRSGLNLAIDQLVVNVNKERKGYVIEPLILQTLRSSNQDPRHVMFVVHIAQNENRCHSLLEALCLYLL